MRVFLGLILLISFFSNAIAIEQTNTTAMAGLDLIRKQQYDNAINVLEQVLETKPNDTEAVAYMGAALLYSQLRIDNARKWYEKSLESGGQAIFWVNYTKETLFGGNIEDDSRGWLRLRKGEIEFSPVDGNSLEILRFSPSQIKEIKQNRTSKRMFHIKSGGKTYNFRPRSGTEEETLLIIILYQKYTQK